jgi:hypothetical protein
MFKIDEDEWLISFVNPRDINLLMEDGKYTIGTCDYETKTIYLANNLRGDLLKRVLCHEIVHSAIFSHKIKLNYEQEELLANIIAIYGESIINVTNKIIEDYNR